jgi:predicted Rossmann fold flavoprotein
MAAPGEVLVIGGGPAGLTAAIHAADRGLRVRVLERMPRPGLKLLASGGGHCNLTNTASTEQTMAAFGRQGRFMRDALAAMDGAGLRTFIDRLGVPTRVEADGFHVFPCSRSARDVQQALRDRAAALGVEIVCGRRARTLLLEHGRVVGVATEDGTALPCRCLLLATGGPGYPGLGGSADGHDLARQAGHTIIPPVPALTSLQVAEPWVGGLAGVVLPEVVVTLAVSRPPPPQRGPLLFTHRGLSGPPILNLAGTVARHLLTADAVPLRIDLSPGTTAAAWERRCDDWASRDGRRHLRNLLRETMPTALAEVLCERIPGLAGRPVAEVARAPRRQLAADLAQLPLSAVATGGFDEAMATSGGVQLRDVDPRSLRSRLAPGLYLAGEVLDLDGPCGGYNLQWAFSSGALAGQAMATDG